MRKHFFTFVVLVVAGVFTLPHTALMQTNGAELKTTFSPVVRQVAPSVVNIFTEKVVQRRSRSLFDNDPFFQQFFGQRLTGPLRQRVERSLGSGVVVTAQGHIVTNYHVIKGATAIKVVFNDKREVAAEIVNADQNMDIAILKLKLGAGENVPYLSFGDSDNLEVGDVVLAVGNPFGVGQSVSMGIVSALGRTNLGTSQYENFIQTDAAINPGNSGGALVDSSGRLVGINTAIFSKSGGHQGIGFATPANSVQAILRSILATGKVERPWFGAGTQDLTVALAEKLGMDTPSGVLLNDLVEGSPAQKAGLKVGDIILTLDGYPVNDTRALNNRIALTRLNRPSTLTVWREGKELRLPIRFTGLPERRKEDQLALKGRHPLNGYVVERLSPTLNQQLNLPLGTKGIAIVKTPKSQGFSALNLKQGDILLSINKQEIRSLRDTTKALNARPRAWQVVYKRGNSVVRAVVQ